MAKNNESIGISAEVAIAKSFNIPVNADYVARSEKTIVDLLLKYDRVKTIFENEKIPDPKQHIAEGQNPVDFVLSGEKTLSVKTNQEGLGKVAPQVIGQATAQTYFSHLEKHLKNLNICTNYKNDEDFEDFKNFRLDDELTKQNLSDTDDNRSYIFKTVSMKYTAHIVNMYWNNLFDCDYYLHFFNLENHEDPLKNYVLLGKAKTIVWDKSKFTFTQLKDNWNESNTLKYCEISMGEFQVHRKRNCFKFRFNMKGIMELIRRGKI